MPPPMPQNITSPSASSAPTINDIFTAAPPLERNQLIVDTADFVVAVWDGSSTGTKDAVTRAEQAGTPVCVYSPDCSLLFCVPPDALQNAKRP